MKKFYFLFIILFFRINSQIKENPKFLVESKNPYVLSTNDNYYYVMTLGKSLKINKESGEIEKNINNNYKDSNYYFYFEDKSYNNYLFYSNKYYQIIYNEFISFKEIEVKTESEFMIKTEMTKVGSIAKNNDFIIYGYRDKYLLFSGKSRYYRAYATINNINEKLTCKFISDNNYICATIINYKLEIHCLEYIIKYNPRDDYLLFYEAKKTLRYTSVSGYGLYDTKWNNIKILCRKSSQKIECGYLEITIYTGFSRGYSYNLLGDEKIVFISSNVFTENNCYYSRFNSEDLFCCALKDYIQCYRIYSTSHKIIKDFKISSPGDNSHLTIKANIKYVTFFFMNNENYVYEYYIYLPECENKYYIIYNSLNENKNEGEMEKLNNLFTVKTNKYYFELKKPQNEFGYFTINGERINQRTLIRNNSYIIDFNVTNKEILMGKAQTINYIVSVEDEQAYDKQCQITFSFETPCTNGLYLDNNTCASNCSIGNFPIKVEIGTNYFYTCNKCYQNCKTCSKKGDSNEMNCETCKENQIKYNDNCYDIDDELTKSFFEPENVDSNSTSCYKLFGLFIKPDSNECIPMPNEDDGYYISNKETGLLSKCHESCLSCLDGPIRNDYEYIQSMGCSKCQDANDLYRDMIKVENNCFKILNYNDTKIIFNISEINSTGQIGACKYFGKAIYYGQYECIDKPNNTYYILSDENENTGIIKNCHEACNFCLGEGNEHNTNCTECAQDYIRAEGSETHCIKNDTNFLDYYVNTSEDTYNDCYYTCNDCNESYNQTTDEMNCISCIDGYYFIYGENNCYNNTLLNENKYYFNRSDNKFHKCYYTCSECFNSEPNEENHNCVKCADNYYKLENDLYPNNCYDNETINSLSNETINTIVNTIEKDVNTNNCLNSNYFITPAGNCGLTCPIGTVQFSLNNSCLFSCPHNYIITNNKCILKEFESDTTLIEFKNQIKDDVISYVNSSKVINGSNFLAAVLSSNNMNQEELLKNGISAIDLGNCSNVIKEFYNISEKFIVVNIESKNDESKKNESKNYNEKSFNLGKNTQLEIYDYSGRKLNLSVCKEDIKIMKYIGDINKQLDMDSAKSLSEQGIDVFNKNDKFFHDICHQYNNPDGKDIIINDRRNEIYQDATFCQNGCIYKGINYTLNAANCMCDSNLIQEDNIQNSEQKIYSFESIKDSFISSLISFNFDVLRCYNLALNIKILTHNIGFYCLSSMFILQIIFFFVYLAKKLKPLKNFMLLFKTKNNKKMTKNNVKATPPPKNNSTKKFIINNSENIELDKGKKYIKSKFNDIQKNKQRNKDNIIKKIHRENGFKNENNNILNKDFDSINDKLKIDYPSNILNSPNEIDSKKTIIVSNNFAPNINIKQPIININNKSLEENNLRKENNNNIYHIKNRKQQLAKKGKNNIKDINKMETLEGIINNKINKSKINNGKMIKLLQSDSDIQDLDYEEAIIHDKRSYLKMCLGFLIDSQIILDTFCTDNNLDLLAIKLSFLVFTFQISFFYECSFLYR